MKHLNTSKLTYAFYALALTLFASFSSFAQVQTPRHIATGANSGGFYEYLPEGYQSSGSQTYPLIIFVHGIGELGQGNAQDLPKLLYCWFALPKRIQEGQFPTSFTVGGQTHKFIVLSPQFKQWPSASDVNDVINYALQNYRVNTSRIYVTGLSMGGGTTFEYAAAFPSRVAAIVPTCGASWPSSDRAQAIANGGVAVWGTHNQFDGTVSSSNTIGYVDQISSFGGVAKKTIWSEGGHDSWTRTYDPTFTENGLNIYQWMLQYQKGGSTPPPPPPPPATVTTHPLPGKVEAERYSAMSGIQTENTQDAGGGQNVGWIDQGDWMDYSVNPSTAGTYTVQFRVASPNSGGQLQLKKADGSVLATVSIPNTWGFQSWQTVTANISLSAGTQTIRLQSNSSGWNINWMDFQPASSAIPPPAATTHPLPGKVEAERYSAMSGIQTENTQDAGGGQNVGWIDQGDWMDYSVNPSTAGTYTVQFRVASPNSGGQLQLKKADGSVLATVSIPNTWGFQSWQTVTANISLSAGTQTLRVQSTGAGWNFNWMDFASGGSTPPPPPPSSSSSKIEAENYTAMHGIQTENTQDVGGGKNVGWVDQGDWMDYSVNTTAAGTYTLNFRIASPYWGGKLHIKKSDGSILYTLDLPLTGGFQTWQTASATVNLSAGAQTIRIESASSAGWNFNWMELVGGSSTPPPPTPTSSKIEAENFASMSGIQTENTQDAGGGQNVGWIDQGDWMDYSINPSAAGTYTLSFRVATPYWGTKLHVKKSDGSTLSTVDLPLTGGFQTWQTVSTTINLSAGAQTIRIESASSAGWNFNWMELASGSGSVTGRMVSAETEVSANEKASEALSVFPNPVTDRFAVQLNNELTGALQAEVVNMQGVSVKTFRLNKTNKGTAQFYLSIGELPQGNYIIKTTMKEWSQSKSIIKK